MKVFSRNCDVYKTKENPEKEFMSEPCEEPCGNCAIKDINNECGTKWLSHNTKERKRNDS